MKKILVPTDFSALANNAFVHALEMANHLNAELLLLHTYELPVVDNQFYPQNYQTIFDSIEMANFERFKDLMPQLHAIAEERKLNHVRFSHSIMDGDLVQNINECVKNEGIDLIVMGTSGATGWKEFFIGTNTGEVISTVAIPVLCVPASAEYTFIKNIGFTTRFREKDKSALWNTIEIAQKNNAVVKCLYVKTAFSDVEETQIEDWRQTFKNEPVHFFIVEDDNPMETILDFITSQEIDVLAVLTHKRHFFVSLFESSFAEKITNRSDIPVLVLH